MAIDKIGSAAITDSAVTDAKLSFNANQFRNILINGDMSIAQRGTSISSVTGTNASCDRWRFAASSAGTWTISRSTTVPTGQGFATSFKADCTTANGSLSAGSILRLSQFIEGQDLQYLKKGTSSAESLTMSFWVRSAKTGTYIINLKDRDNTRVISKSYTISSADTWEKKTITCDGDTTGAYGNDNDWSLEVHFYLVAGSTYSSGTLNTSWNSQTTADIAVGQVNLADSTSNDWYVTGVQLEAGTAASDFEFLPKGINTTRCQRYFQKSYNLDVTPGTATDNGVQWTGGSSDSGNNVSFLPSFKTTMRAAPTVTGYARDGTSGQGSYFRSGSSGNGTFAAHMYGQNSVSVYVGIGASYTSGTVAAHTTLASEFF